MADSSGTAFSPSGLADILERVLDKGIVIAGDISVAVGGTELLTIRIRLIVASVERAQAMGIDWWTNDPHLRGIGDDESRQDRLELERARLMFEKQTLLLEAERSQLALEVDNAKLRAELRRLKRELTVGEGVS